MTPPGVRGDRPNGFHRFTQYAMPGFTIIAAIFTSFKHPEYGQAIGLVSQTFWGYTGWRAWKDRNEKGILINTIIISSILSFGTINYWIIGGR